MQTEIANRLVEYERCSSDVEEAKTTKRESERKRAKAKAKARVSKMDRLGKQKLRNWKNGRGDDRNR